MHSFLPSATTSYAERCSTFENQLKKVIGILLSIISLFGGVLYLFKILSNDFKGYKGYCTYVDIQFGDFTNLFELCILSFFVLFTIAVKFFNVGNKIVKNRSSVILLFLITNIAYIAVRIIEFPRVLSYANWGFYPDNTPRHDQFLGLDYNPLIPLFFLFSLFLIFFNLLLKQKKIDKYYKAVNWIILLLMVIVSITVINSIEYEMCAG